MPATIALPTLPTPARLYNHWTTKQELDWLARVGEFGRSTDRRRCLIGYVKSCKRRTEWGAMKREECEAYARQCLVEEFGVVVG